jgi:outer membrane protein OmpA-like peptidoglycan-associated protein
MRRTWTPWLLGALLALAAPAWAQSVPPAGEERTTGTTTMTTTTQTDTTTTTTTETTTHHGTVLREDVRTWTIDVDGREWEVHPATPTYEGTTGLFHMPSAYTLPKGRFSFSLFRDNLDRSPKDEDISIHGLSIGVGLTSRLELYGNVGIQNRIDADALFEPGRVNDYPFVATPWETGFGDVKVGLKLGLLNDYMNDDPVGLAIRAFAKLPTADEEQGLGTGAPSFGADLILSKSLDAKADLHASIGYQVNGDPDEPVEVDLANAFKWAVGLNIPACSWIQLQAELMGTRYSGGDEGFASRTATGVNNRVDPGRDPQVATFGIGEQDNPLDLVVGPVIWIKPGFFIRPAISWNFGFEEPVGIDQSSRSWTGRHISIGYHPGWGCREVAAPAPPPPPPPANRPPTVSCEIERTELLPGESTRVRAVASDADGDALSYDWSATAGRIVGTGASVTFDSTGMTPPASATITVRVSDGRGGDASATCPVRMRAAAVAPRAAEAISCVAGGFPRNHARLNNVDKACLDDVAQRLRSDPRARVIVVGHADPGERMPEVIARRRAEAVRDYLTRERGIETARITVRSAAATRPLDTGTDAAARARNRRVELWFVPEGATAPEMD